MAVGGIDTRPAGPDRRDDGIVLLALAAEPPAACEAAVEHEVADPLRVPDRITDRNRGSLRDAQQREALQPDRVDDSLEVGDPGLQRRIARVGSREPASPLVVADDV